MLKYKTTGVDYVLWCMFVILFKDLISPYFKINDRSGLRSIDCSTNRSACPSFLSENIFYTHPKTNPKFQTMDVIDGTSIDRQAINSVHQPDFTARICISNFHVCFFPLFIKCVMVLL